MRILAVDDHGPTRELLTRTLAGQGHEVTSVGSCAEALARVAQPEAAPFQLAILDVMLPDGSGLDLCRALRDDGLTIPILLLTARHQVGDRVAGLDAGADDYLPKPFALSELLARVRALGRRAPALHKVKIVLGALVVDQPARRVYVEGRPVPMTARELAILETLAVRQGHVVEKNDLLEAIWGEASETASASLEVLVHRLRRKLGPASPLLRTVRGVGYLLDREP